MLSARALVLDAQNSFILPSGTTCGIAGGRLDVDRQPTWETETRVRTGLEA